MHEYTERIDATAFSMEQDLQREFEARLIESSTLAFRVAYSVPDKLRLVVVLAGNEEHDIREVAALLRLPEGTVKSRLFLARQRLKELMQ